MSMRDYYAARDAADAADLAAQKAAPVAPEPSSRFRRIVADPLVGVARGAAKLPNIAVGLADIVTGGQAGKFIEDTTGYDFEAADRTYNPMLTPETQAAQAKVSKSFRDDGFVQGLGTALANPSAIVQTVAESVPGIGAGGVIARAGVRALGAASKFAPLAVGAGEGAVTAGQIAEDVRVANPDRKLTGRQAGLAALAGFSTAGISAAGSKFASSALGTKLGLSDIDNVVAGVVRESGGVATPNVLKRAAAGIVQEGVLEELPQSMQETALQNIAQGKKWDDGLAESAGMGLLSGGMMGAGTSAALGGNGIAHKILAAKLAKEGQDRDARTAAGPLPRTAALLASLEGVAPDSLTRTSALLNSIPNTGLGILDPNASVGPESPNFVADSENFPGATADLVARRKEAEAQSAAAFDTTNPVIPNAPENTYVPQVIPELGPPPATGGNIDLGLPTPARTGYAAMPGTQRQQVTAERRATDPDGWLAAFTTAQNEIGFTGNNTKEVNVRALELHDAAQAAQQTTSTGPDYTQTTPEESHALFMERHAVDPDGWTQAINTAARANSEAGISDAHANRVSALALHDGLLAERQAAPEAPLLQDPTTGAPVSFGSEPAASDNVEDYAPTDRFAGMNRTELMALRQEVPAEAWNAAIRQVNPEYAEVTDDMLRGAARIVEHDDRIAAATPQMSQDATAWMDDDTLLSEGEMDERQAIIDVLGGERWREIRVEVRTEADNARPDGTVSLPAVQREAMRRAGPEMLTHHQNPDNTGATPDRYTTMNHSELAAAFNVFEQQNAAMANSCFAWAWGEAPTNASTDDALRAALREFEFRVANPVAQAPVAAPPSWSDDNAALTTLEDQSYRALINGSNVELDNHWRAIRSEIHDELIAAGRNPVDYPAAVRREVLLRFARETTQDVQGTSYSTVQSHDGTFMVVDSNGDVVNRGFATRDAAYTFAQHEFASTITSTPVPTTPQQGATVTPEDSAPRGVSDITAGARNFTSRNDFVAWVYGDNMGQPSVASSIDGIYGGTLSERISRANGWVDSPAKDRLIYLLTVLRSAGYETLQEVHEGVDPNNRPAPPPPPAAPDPYQAPPVLPMPVAHTPEVVDSVSAANTPEQHAAATALSSLAKRLAESLSGNATTFNAEGRAEWKNAFESIFSAVMNKVDHFRYGTLSDATRANPTIQGIVDDLNDYQRSIGSDLEIKVLGHGNNPLTSPGSADIRIRRGNGDWYSAVTTSFGSGGTGATNGQGEDRAIGANMPNQAQRQPQDGGYGYYALHLIAKYVPNARTSSGGMYPVNQLRRLEHALSFLVRHGGPANVRINAEGIGEVMSGDSPISALAARSYRRIMNIYPNLIRYTFDFKTGKIKDENGTVIPVTAITGHARLNGSTRPGGNVGTNRNTYEAQQHVGYSQIEREGFSDATVIRALITQEVLRSATTASRPGVRRTGAILNAIARRTRAYTDLIFYNRTEGVAVKSDLEAPTLQQALMPIIDALKKFIPVNVIQTMAHLPGYHEGMPSFNAAYHNGAIYVVADQVASVAEAKTLVLDHELRHAGLRQVLGKGMDTFLKQAWFAKTDDIQGFANGKGIDTSTVEGRLEAAEEFIVSLAQEAKNHPLLDRAIAKIRSLLRAIGFDIQLSRAELRAMVSRASMLKESTAADGTTRFSRTATSHASTADAVRDSLNEIGASTVSGFKKGTNYLAQALMPIDRLITRAIRQAEYKFLVPTLKAYESLREQKQAVADSIASTGVRQYNKMRALADTTEKWELVNGVLRDGRLWGMFPEKELTEQPWTTEGWAAKLRGETGKSLHAAHADLNARYKEMERLGLSQEYMNTRALMVENHERLKRETMGLIDKVTVATDAATSIRFTDATGSIHTVAQDSTSMAWELRNKDNALVRSATTREGVLAGMAPYGKREEMKAKLEAQFQTVKGAYAPLSRFGDIVMQVFKPVIATDGTAGTERVARFHFETEADLTAAWNKIMAENPDYKLERSDKSQAQTATRNGVPVEFLSAIDESVDRLQLDAATADELKDAFARTWIQLSPESNAMKHSIKGKNLAGFDEDMMRGFQTYTNQMGQSIASITHGVPLKQAFKDMETAISTEEGRGKIEGAREGRALVDHLRTHASVVANDRTLPAVSMLKKITSVWYLASPSVLLVQSAQPFVQALPNLAVKFGYAKSFAAISKAYRAQASIKAPAYSNEKLDRWMPTADKIIERRMAGLPFNDLVGSLAPAEQLLLGMAIETKRGGIDITLSHEARAVANGETKGWTDHVTEKAMWAMQVSEIMSRKATFAAAFQLEMDAHGDFTKAIDGGHATVKTALFDYAHSNRPAWLLGNVGSTLFQFQIFRAHTLSRLYQLTMDSLDKGQTARDARKELGYMLMNTMLISGMSGLPLPTALIAAFVGLYGAATGDDEPWDIDQWQRSMVGEGVTGDVMMKGLGAAFGVDISRRVGMDGIFDLFSGEPQANAKPSQQFEYYAGKLMGPAGNIVKDVAFKLPDMVKKGQWGDIIRQTTPKPVKDMVKAYDMQFGEGVYSNSGKLLVDSTDLNVWDMTLALVGVNPMSLSNAQEQNFTAQKLLGAMGVKRTALQKDFQRAVISQDVEAIDDAIEKINRFSEKNPQFAIGKKTLASGVKQAMRKELGLEDKNVTKIKQQYGIGQGE